ncbi:MAG: hypothetical protein KAI17_28270, partial [Thiotrichaceae bacterium]|nr:hypothetical protein [Thiotrichaceae bacterium]
EDDPFWFGGLLDSLQSSEKLVEISVSIALSDFAKAKFNGTEDDFVYLSEKLKVHICFDDIDSSDSQNVSYKPSLIGFWKVVNILQFLSDVSWCAKTSLGTDLYDAEEVIIKPSAVSHNSNWAGCLEETLLSGNLDLLISSELPVAEAGYELMEGDEVIALAELAWEKQKVAIFPHDADEDIEQFKKQGWSCLVDPINEKLIEELKSLIKNS